jgi:hypothetical protein
MLTFIPYDKKTRQILSRSNASVNWGIERRHFMNLIAVA